MTKKWIAINLLLLVITGVLGWRLHDSILQFKADNDLSKIQPVRDLRQKTAAEKPVPNLAAAKSYLPGEFAVIPERNIFSLSRSRDEKADALAVPETPPLLQKPILVGVTLADNQQKALIIDPMSSPQDKNRRAQLKRIGDVYQGYTITSISLDRIVLESGTRREIIPLHEGSKRTPGGKTPVLSTRVVPIGGGGASGGAPVTVAAASARASAPTTATAIGTTVQQETLQARQAAAERVRQQAGVSAERAQQQAQPAQQQSPSTGKGTDSQGTRVIRTPFGDIIRPARD